MIRLRVFKLALIAFCVLGLATVVFAQTRDFNIPGGELKVVLDAYVKQSGVQLIYRVDEVSGVTSKGASGALTADDALSRILEGTGFTTRRDSSGAIAIVRNLTQQRPAAEKLEKIEVTGSRLLTTATEGAQDVKTYTREQIEQSGQTTIAGFLNTLPYVSVSITENGTQTFLGVTTVQLHGLPVGTTLVLINGRRVEASGSALQAGQGVLDLNNIPPSAVDRVEVVSAGSSAVYGSDAIAGVVNIILRKDFDGFEASVKYGHASGSDEVSANLAWGKNWEKGSLTLIGSYQSRSELDGSERSITANQDYSRFGGSDARAFDCHPGNVFTLDGSNLPGTTAPFAAVPVGFNGTPTQQVFAATAGMLNRCSLQGYTSFIPATRRFGIYAEGDYNVMPSVTFFAELMYSHVEQSFQYQPASLFGLPLSSFASFTVPASNPFNPFGETVGVSDLLPGVGRIGNNLDTDFFRGLAGAKGNLPHEWSWEVAGWQSQDRSHQSTPNQLNFAAAQAALNATNPAFALNPFVSDAQGSPALLQSLVYTQLAKYTGKTTAINGFLRGPIFELPSGRIEVVVGAEYDRDTLFQEQINSPYYPPNSQSTFYRDSHAFFGEARVPIIANRSSPQAGDVLAVGLAARYDNYSSFGGKTTPQVGIEWRPVSTLLVRGTYGGAFKAPNLIELNQPIVSFPTQVVDPLHGNQVVSVTGTFGGNPHLQPETGNSNTVGFVYSSDVIPNLNVSITHWDLEEKNSIQSLDLQTIVNNESLFPGAVIRNAAGVITQVNGTNVNFGTIRVRGLDYLVNYRIQTGLGEWLPGVAVTQTYHYTSALQPGVPSTDRVSKANDDGNFAPEWKGTVMLGWKQGSYAANVAGRYVGRYQDYDSTREIGNIWFCDVNVRYAIGQALAPSDRWLKGAYVEFGGVNIFNKLPQYSNYNFGVVGYDPAEADLRGRFLYARVGAKF